MALPAQMHLIALLPSEEIQRDIKRIKEDINTHFGAKHALKLPAHITLQPPFWVPDQHTDLLHDILSAFTQKQTAFSIRLDGFDCFAPRVIFVRIDQPDLLINLQADLKKALPAAVFLREKERRSRPFHPHITVATRDLNPKSFKKAWAKYRDKNYTAGFRADRLVLFKHDGKLWHRTDHFLFNDKTTGL